MRPQYPLDPKALFATASARPQARLTGISYPEHVAKRVFLGLNRLGKSG
jgi:hypothetical protein